MPTPITALGTWGSRLRNPQPPRPQKGATGGPVQHPIESGHSASVLQGPQALAPEAWHWPALISKISVRISLPLWKNLTDHLPQVTDGTNPSICIVDRPHMVPVVSGIDPGDDRYSAPFGLCHSHLTVSPVRTPESLIQDVTSASLLWNV